MLSRRSILLLLALRTSILFPQEASYGYAPPDVEKNSFEHWHFDTGKQYLGIWHSPTPYKEIGVKKRTGSWSTVNRGAVIGGNVSAEPVKRGDGTALKLSTKIVDIDLLFYSLYKVSAGTLFTGKMEYNQKKILSSVNDGKEVELVEKGVPFTKKPVGVKFDYKYIPGENFRNEKGTLEGSDSFSVQVLLENRSVERVVRVATLWVIMGKKTVNWETIQLPLRYGPLRPGDAGFGSYAESETGYDEEMTPTHIAIMFKSSAFAAYPLMHGADGSTLYIDNFELIY